MSHPTLVHALATAEAGGAHGSTLPFYVMLTLFLAGGCFSLWIAVAHRDWMERTPVALGGGLLFFLLFGFNVMALQRLDIRAIGGIALGAVGMSWSVFMAHAAATLFMAVRRRAMSDDQVPEVRTYDQAESAEHRKDWDAAERLYKTALAENPGDLEVKRRLGELAIKKGDLETGLRALRSLLPQIPQREKKLSLAFRIADVLAGPMGDREGARALLKSMESEAAGTAEEEGWRRRLAGLG